MNTAAEALWGELCGKTWRVELDYGLADAAADPRDDLLLVCSWYVPWMGRPGLSSGRKDSSKAEEGKVTAENTESVEDGLERV